MELNPDNPTTQTLRTEWHKVLALVLHKLNVDHVVIRLSDLERLAATPDVCVVAHDRSDGLHIHLTTMAEGERLARQAAADPKGRIDDVVAPAPAPRVTPAGTGHTTDPTDPRLKRGLADTEPVPQAEVYLVLSEEERAKGYVRPVRTTYEHVGTDESPGCGTPTRMSAPLAETYAREPRFYGATYCCGCRKHLPVSEFIWSGTTERVGS